MNPSNHVSSTPSGAAAMRQPEQHSSEPVEDLPVTEGRAARLLQLRQEYQRGTYQVDAAQLSADIVEKHLKK